MNQFLHQVIQVKNYPIKMIFVSSDESEIDFEEFITHCANEVWNIIPIGDERILQLNKILEGERIVIENNVQSNVIL